MVSINTLFAAITLLAILWSLWLAILIIKDVKEWLVKTERQKDDDKIYDRWLDRAKYLQKEGYHFDIYTGVWTHNVYPDFTMSDHDVLVKDEIPHLPTQTDFDELYRAGLETFKTTKEPPHFGQGFCKVFTPILKADSDTIEAEPICFLCGLTEDKH